MSKTKTTVLPLLLLLFLFSSTVVDAQSPSDDDNDDPWQQGSNVSPSMAIVVIVLVLGFFITGCIFIYIQHCTDTSSSTVTPSSVINNNNITANRGLSQSVIDTFPTFHYSAVKDLQIGKGALECAVCLSDFDDDETLRLLPKCDHVFHSECIDTWLEAHTTCPVCRHNLAIIAPDSGEDDSLADAPELPTSEVRITIPGRFPRSHSTGHSLSQPSDDCERFTLRLPAEVRRQIIARTMMKRATSLVALPRQSSSRRGYRGGGGGEGSGSSRYGRLFGRSFMMRVASFRSTAAKAEVDGGMTAESKVVKRSSAVEQSIAPPLPV
ncbi:hypothetical protein RND81_06G002400 [Saponaria officinalis]|uniref:RING-type E3 ubiquitin transferase n=1 Tax=Saponaria officinalis TaxID=3572 RepID=A0AAW1K5N3_SAPOF